MVGLVDIVNAHELRPVVTDETQFSKVILELKAWLQVEA